MEIKFITISLFLTILFLFYVYHIIDTIFVNKKLTTIISENKYQKQKKEKQFESAENKSQTILTRPFASTDKFSNLFDLDRQFPQTNWTQTQDYSQICGKTLFNETIICTEQLSQVQPHPDEVVPNLLHYVLHYPNRDITFYHAVCIMSGFWFIQPKYLVLWYMDQTPTGYNWEYLMRNLSSNSTRVLFMPIRRPELIYNDPMDLIELQVDVVRIEILYWFGGIYLDVDVVVVKSLKPLFKYTFTAGRETSNGLCSATMMSSRGNLFLKRWHLLFRFHIAINAQWADLAVKLLHTLQKLAPEYVHVEEESMDRPNWMSYEVEWIYGNKRVWNWKEKNYCVHLWIRKFDEQSRVNIDFVRKHDSMFGDLLRFVLFGNTMSVLP